MLPAILAVLAVLVVVVIVLARRGAGRATERVETRLGALDIERQAKATFFGLGSGDTGQVRILGTLVLTPDALVFLQFVPEGEVTVTRTDISAAELTATYLDKTHPKDLLLVSFTGPEGAEQAAWELPDSAAWRDALGA